jgi:serine phosphatase RsbU (regulator of sigma subunit)
MSDKQDLRARVRAVVGFADLADAGLDALIAASATLRFSAGEVMIEQGAESDFADLLLEGEAAIGADSARGSASVGVLRAPVLIGEVGAFAGLPRTASVRARTDMLTLRIPKAALLAAALAAPSLLIEAIGRLGERLSRVNRAIGLYTEALEALGRGELTPALMEELRHPVPDLADFAATFAGMADELVLRRQRNDEMASAAIIQRALLPDPEAFAEETGVDVFAAMQPARDVGGDFFDLLALSDGRLAIGVGDVCGKGVPAALYMGITKTLLRIKLLERPDLPAAIREANAYLTTNYPAEQFATLLYAAYDPASGAVEYVSCGHPAARIRRADGRIEALPAGGLPIGMFEDLRVVAREAQLDGGDLLMIVSDGVTEAADAADNEFGEARLAEALCAEEGGAAAAVEAVVAAARVFAAGAPQSDDITCLALGR